MAVGVQVPVLDGILGIGIILQDRSGNAEEPSIVLAHERLEGGMVMPADALDEVGVFTSAGGTHMDLMPSQPSAFPQSIPVREGMRFRLIWTFVF